MTTKTILFPTDFSDASEAAFDYALQFARGAQARLLIVHVQEPILPFVGGEIAYIPPTATDPHIFESMLRAVVPTDPLIDYSHRLLQGDAASEIVRLAIQEQVDTIVLGTHGRTGLTRLLMGSTAEKVIRHAPCPVIAIKHPHLVAAVA
jgi:nucleotide-binding universal stress UspA family protein